jgi:hypothetical protein
LPLIFELDSTLVIAPSSSSHHHDITLVTWSCFSPLCGEQIDELLLTIRAAMNTATDELAIHHIMCFINIALTINKRLTINKLLATLNHFIENVYR